MAKGSMNLDEYWQHYLKSTGEDRSREYGCCFTMGSNAMASSALIQRVLSGAKVATTACYPAYEIGNEPLPEKGTRGIVTDWAGTPYCVIEVTAVTVLPFREVTVEMCTREGEDQSLAQWRQVHGDAFAAEGKAEGFPFTWDTPVVFVEFRVVFR